MTSIILEILARVAEALLGDLFKDIVKGFSKYKKACTVAIVILGLALFSFIKLPQNSPGPANPGPGLKGPAQQEPKTTPAPPKTSLSKPSASPKPSVPQPSVTLTPEIPAPAPPAVHFLTVLTPPGRSDCKEYVADAFQSELGESCKPLSTQATIRLSVNSLASGNRSNPVAAPDGRTAEFTTRTATADITATITYTRGSRPVLTIRKQGKSTVFSDSSTSDATLERDALDDALKQISARIKELT